MIFKASYVLSFYISDIVWLDFFNGLMILIEEGNFQRIHGMLCDILPFHSNLPSACICTIFILSVLKIFVYSFV